MLCIGQCLLGKIKFKDGTLPRYKRPYLIVEIIENEIGVLNVSSIEGKEEKLSYQTNREIFDNASIFLKNSFVKLDSLVHIPISEAEAMIVLGKGKSIDKSELNEIIESMQKFI
jgi:hypothetical protein